MNERKIGRRQRRRHNQKNDDTIEDDNVLSDGGKEMNKEGVASH